MAAIAAVRETHKSKNLPLWHWCKMSLPIERWYTWLGSGSTSFQFSVRFPHGTGVKGLCLTDGRMRYNQLEKEKGPVISFYNSNIHLIFPGWFRDQGEMDTSFCWLGAGRWRQIQRAVQHKGHRDRPEECSVEACYSRCYVLCVM